MKGTKFLSSKAILGIVTALAVVVTVAGSFAAWDTLSATTDSQTLTVRKPATITLNGSPTFATQYGTAEDNTAVSTETVTFDVADHTQASLSTIELEFSATPAESKAFASGDYKVTIYEGSDTSGTPVLAETDFTALTDGKTTVTDSAITASNAYTIKIVASNKTTNATLGSANTLALKATLK